MLLITPVLAVIVLGTYIPSTCAGSYSHISKEHRQDGNKCCSTDPDKPSNGCEQTSLFADQYIQAVITPQYPHGLPSHKQCTWTIQSKPGKRVRVDFRDFYLIGPNQDGECHEQFVMVLSSQKYKMGPFCGNTGLQSIVSPDNLLVIQLEIKNSKSSENYRGFRMEFTESEETPSAELRPSNWINGQDMFLVGNQMLNALSQFGSTNLQPTPATISVQRPTPRKPLRPSRNNLNAPRNTRKPWLTTRQRNTPRPKFYGPNDNNNNNYRYSDKGDASKKSNRLPLEAIAGIAVGGVVLLALLLLVVFKIRQLKRSETVSSTQETKANKEPKSLSAQVYAEENVSQLPVTSKEHFQVPIKVSNPPTYGSLTYNLGNTIPEYQFSRNSYERNIQPETMLQLQGDMKQNTSLTVYPTVQRSPPNQMMFYEPASGTYVDWRQLSTVHPGPLPSANVAQPPVGGYYTLPQNESRMQNSDFMKKASTMQYPTSHKNRSRTKKHSKRKSTLNKKQKRHKKAK